MKRTRIVRLAFILIALMMVATYAQAEEVSKAGTTSAAFLKIGVGSRGISMGESQVATSEGAASLYWNPAGLAGMSSPQVILNHYDYIADMNFDYIGVIIPLGEIGTFGASFTSLSMDDIERTTVLEPEGTRELVSAGMWAAGLSYGRALTDRFRFGGSIKYITESLWHTSANTVAADVGLLYRTLWRDMRLGMSISNFGSGMQLSGQDLLLQVDVDPTSAGNNESTNANLETDEFPLPILFRVGLASNITRDFLGLNNHDLIVEINAVHPNDDHEYINLGMEYEAFGTVAVRAGYRKMFLGGEMFPEDSQGGLNLGAGVNLNVSGFNLRLDYARADYGILDFQNKFTLLLTF